jgi:Outer membrane protein beta-barrel domain
MKHQLTFLLAFAAFSAFGQGTPTMNFKRFQIGIIVSPDGCYRTLKNNDGSPSSDIVIGVRNENETFKLGCTAGLNVCYYIKSNFGFETGIQYSNKGYRTKNKILTWGTPDQSLPIKSKFIYGYHYIDIPLRMNYIMGHRKVRFIASAGLTANIFIKETQRHVLEYEDGKKERDKTTPPYDYKKINISPTFSVGIDYRLNNRMNLRIEPTFRYGILKINDKPIVGYLYSGGLNVGLFFGQ